MRSSGSLFKLKRTVMSRLLAGLVALAAVIGMAAPGRVGAAASTLHARAGQPAHRPFRGLLGVHSRCGLHTRAITKFVTAIRGLQTFRHLHACPGCFRLERSAGWALHPLGKAPPCHSVLVGLNRQFL